MKNSEISNEEHFYLNSSSRLQEYITNLKSCISIFESKLEKNMSVKESFFEEYIDLEDKILDELQLFRNKDMMNAKIEYLIEEFMKFWSQYQDTWSNEYWEIYEVKRSFFENEEELCRNFKEIDSNSLNTSQEKKKASSSFMKSNYSENTTINTNALSSPRITLTSIDDEISQIKDTPITAHRNEIKKKNRNCDHLYH